MAQAGHGCLASFDIPGDGCGVTGIEIIGSSADRHPVFYFYVADGTIASDYVLIKLEKKSDHREFQVGSFGGVTSGKSGMKRDKEIPYKAEHVAIRTYRITLDTDLKPGEYGFFKGTGAQSTMASGRGSARSGGSASGRIYDFTIPE
jgi:hypothetical protein